MEIPKEVREEHMAICNECKKRMIIAKCFDWHFDWLDCLYNCENDYDHWVNEASE